MSGDFDQKSAHQLREEILERAEMGPEVPVVIYINSFGGEVYSLMSILDTIDSIPNKVVTVCCGTAMSCGAVLLAYGDERYMGSNSRVMVHQASWGAFGTTNEVEASSKELIKLNNQVARILADKTGRSYNEIKELYANNIDKYFSPAEAKKFGLIDKIGTPILQQKITYELK